MPAQAAVLGDDAAAIRVAAEELAEAIRTNDLQRWLGAYAPDAVLTPEGNPTLVGEDALRSWAKRFYELFRVVAFECLTEELMLLSPHRAFQRSRYAYTVRVTQTGQQDSASGNRFTIWQQQPDGSWKIIREIWNSGKHGWSPIWSAQSM